MGPRPPDYEVDEGGTLIIGGDVFTSCSGVGEAPDPSELRGVTPKVQAQIERAGREAIRACRAAGFDTAGDLPAGASIAEGDAALPETGGPALPGAPLAAGAVLLLAGGLLASRVIRR